MVMSSAYMMCWEAWSGKDSRRCGAVRCGAVRCMGRRGRDRRRGLLAVWRVRRTTMGQGKSLEAFCG